MTEQPAEPDPGQPRKDVWAGLFGGPIPTNPPPYQPKPQQAPRQNPFLYEEVSKDYNGLGLSDKQLAALGALPAPGERPPVELSAERRAHTARFSAEFKEWVAGGMTRQEALALVAMEIQLEARYKNQRGEQ